MSGSRRSLLHRHREDLGELSHLDEALQLNLLALREGALCVALQELVHAIVEGAGEGRQLGHDRTRERDGNEVGGRTHARSIHQAVGTSRPEVACPEDRPVELGAILFPEYAPAHVGAPPAPAATPPHD